MVEGSTVKYQHLQHVLLKILQFASFSGIAEVFNDEGSKGCDKRDYSYAVYFYTEGIKVNCKDKDLMAELYSNRAHAHLFLGEAVCIFHGLVGCVLVGLSINCYQVLFLFKALTVVWIQKGTLIRCCLID